MVVVVVIVREREYSNRTETEESNGRKRGGEVTNHTTSQEAATATRERCIQ